MSANPIRRRSWLARLWGRRLITIVIGLVVLIAATAAVWSAARNSEPVSRLLFSTVIIGDIEDAVTAAGTLQPSRFVDVGAQVSGQLEQLDVDVGDEVEAGDLVAEIDATVQENRVEASRASLRAQESQLSARDSELALAQANADRQTRLMQEEASAELNYDTALNALARARSSLVQLQSQIQQSRASLASDEALLGYSKIYAPADGTVVSINMREGQTLNASQQTPIILRLADLSTMTVEAEVSEADIGKLREDMEVYFTTLGGGERRWYGRLRQILPTPVVTNNVVLFTTLFDVRNEDGALLPNMTAQVFFVRAAARNVLKVPMGALSLGAGIAGPARAAQFVRPGGGGVGDALGVGENFDREAFRAARNARVEGTTGGGGRMPDQSANAQGMGGDFDREAFKAARAAMGAGPRQAMREGGTRTSATVRVELEDGSLEQRQVEVGLMTRISAEVLSGLQEGDRVVAGMITSQNGSQDRANNNVPFGRGFR